MPMRKVPGKKCKDARCQGGNKCQEEKGSAREESAGGKKKARGRNRCKEESAKSQSTRKLPMLEECQEGRV